MKRTKLPVLLASLFLLVAFLTLAACQAARKPAEPERVVVPEVTKIFFDRQELSAAPPVVRDLAERFADQDARFAVEADGSVWIVAASEDEEERMDLKEVVQRVVNPDTTVLEVRLIEKEEKNGTNNDKTKKAEPLVARLNISNLSNGPVFYVEEEEKEEAEEKESVKSTAPAKNNQPAKTAQPQPEAQFIQVDLPSPGDNVLSPLEVSGKARVNEGAIKVRLRDGEGNILAETETVASQAGNFKAVLNYEKPESPLKGRLEVFSAKNGKEANMKVIPLTIH